MPKLPSSRVTMPVARKPLRSPPTNKVLYIGIDPGGNGGIAGVVDGEVALYEPFPESELECWRMIHEIPLVAAVKLGCTSTKAIIESVNTGFAGTSKSSMAKLYGSYMQLRGFLTAAGISFETVSSKKWQNTLGLTRLKTDGSDKWKKKLKAKAQQLFPKLEVWRRAQVHQLRVCDAILMANYLYNSRKD